MADADPNAAEHADDSKIRAEWRRVEQERIAEEVAEAREDVAATDQPHAGPRRFIWIAFAIALVAGIVVTALIEGFSTKVAPGEAPAAKEP